jgi:hypothetical protein
VNFRGRIDLDRRPVPLPSPTPASRFRASRSRPRALDGYSKHGSPNAARNFTVRSARRLAGEPRAVDFRKEKKVDRRAIADLWTTNRLDTSLADSLTKNLKKNWFGQPNGRAGVTVSQTSA